MSPAHALFRDRRRRHPHARRTRAAALFAALVAAGLAVTPGAAAAAARAPRAPAGAALRAPRAPAGATCDNPAEPGGQVTEVPWAQRQLAPQRMAPLSTGAGITVAVLDSGVDGGHPQLAGHVKAGFDFLRNAPGADYDCTSHGTAVASLIAAQRMPGIGFAGLAPGVQILPVRVSEHADNSTGDAVSPDDFAKAIRWAVDNGAQIINISLTLDHDYPAVADAIEYAVKTKGRLVVAAVGNHHSTAGAGGPPPSVGVAPSYTPDAPSYPAEYPGVLGVGAINEDGSRLPQSQVGESVDLVAPGGAVLAATRIRGYSTWSGTSFAAPLVSAAAALVWSAAPKLSAEDVAFRLEATADVMPPGRTDEFGYGLVNPYRAVTELLSRPPSGEPVAVPARSVDPAAAYRADTWHRSGQLAALLGVGLGALVVALAFSAVAVRRGRQRHWRPGPPPPVPQPRDESDDGAEEQFFALPRRTPR